MMSVPADTPVSRLWHKHMVRRFIPLGVLVTGWLVLVFPLLTQSKLPDGREFPVHITHFAAWQHVRSCGLCGFWEHTGGGAPFFGDPYTAAQHPFVAVFGLLADPVTAANFTIAAAFLLLGMSGWLYGATFQYPVLIRCWLILMTMYGGHAVGRLEIGTAALPLAVASLAWCAVLAVRWLLRPDTFRLVALALSVAGLCLAGQGYLQLVAALWAVPLCVGAVRMHGGAVVVRALARGAGLVLLLCAPVILGYLQAQPYMQKTADEALPAYQSLGYLLLNLVNAAPQYDPADPAREQLFPYLYANYIGIFPVVLAGVGLSSAWLRRPLMKESISEQHLLWVWLTLVLTAMICVSGAFSAGLLALGIPGLTASVLGWRNIVVVGAAVPLALVFVSGTGVRVVWGWCRRIGDTRLVTVVQVVCCGVLIGSIGDVAAAAVPLVRMVELPRDALALVAELDARPVGAVETEDDMQYLAVLLQGKKNFWKLFYPYHIADTYPLMPARYRIAANETEQPPEWELLATQGALSLYERTSAAGSYVVLAGRDSAPDDVCDVRVEAGDVEVTCEVERAETVTVHEYALPGWLATIDDETVQLNDAPFLRVDVPAGTHRLHFYYRPWGVIFAAVISVITWAGACLWLVHRALSRDEVFV